MEKMKPETEEPGGEALQSPTGHYQGSPVLGLPETQLHPWLSDKSLTDVLSPS